MTEKEAREKARLRPGLVVARITKDPHDRLVIEGLASFAPGHGYRMVEPVPMKEGEFVVLAPI